MVAATQSAKTLSKMKRHILIVILIGLLSTLGMPIFAQRTPVDTAFTFSTDTIVIKKDSLYYANTEGTQFWFSFFFSDAWFYEKQNNPDTLQLELLISTKDENFIQISNPNTGWMIDSIYISPKSTHKITIPSEQGLCMKYDGTIQPTGLLVKSLTDTEFSAYASNFHTASSDATSLLPLEALSNEYIIQTYMGETTAESPFYATLYTDSTDNFNPYDAYNTYFPGMGYLNRNSVILSFNENGDSVFTKQNVYLAVGISHNFHSTDTIRCDTLITVQERIVDTDTGQITVHDTIPGTNILKQVIKTDSGLIYNYDTILYSYYVKVVEEVPPYFAIIADENNTKVQITPSVDLFDGHKAGETYTIILNRGEVYQILGKTIAELSGTHIVSEKKIAVFNGNVCAIVPYNSNPCDHLVEQAIPMQMWGKTYITSIVRGQYHNRFILTAQEDNTTIELDGVQYEENGEPVVLNAKQSTEITLDNTNSFAHIIKTSKNTLCYQYLESCAGNSSWGDPAMVLISPIEQKIKEKTFSPLSYEEFNSNILDTLGHYVNIVTQTEYLDLLTINYEPVMDYLDSYSDYTQIGDNNEYTIIRKHINLGTYTLHSDSGFVAFVYGQGNAESYAYNVGAYIEWIEKIPYTITDTATIHWSIDTLCQTNSIISITYETERLIDSVSFYAAHDSTIHFNSKVEDNERNSISFTAHHVGIDTLFTFAYYKSFISETENIDTVKCDTIIFGVRFPATVITQKWNDFVGAYTEDYSGGYNFTSFQWYRNDTLLDGETYPYLYHANENLVFGAEYSAELTTSDGITNRTCPIVAVEKIDLQPFPTVIEASQKISAPFRDVQKVDIYDITGRLILSQQLNPDNIDLLAPSIQGNYIIRFTRQDGEYRTYKIIIK